MKSILVTLLTAFCFVTGYANDSISFCLWNIENFGKSKTDSDIDFIANTISKYKYYNYTGSPLSYSSAQLCRNYNGGGFTDWYMLAIDELNLL